MFYKPKIVDKTIVLLCIDFKSGVVVVFCVVVSECDEYWSSWESFVEYLWYKGVGLFQNCIVLCNISFFSWCWVSRVDRGITSYLMSNQISFKSNVINMFASIDLVKQVKHVSYQCFRSITSKSSKKSFLVSCDSLSKLQKSYLLLRRILINWPTTVSSWVWVIIELQVQVRENSKSDWWSSSRCD